jgi:hypothetical protein
MGFPFVFLYFDSNFQAKPGPGKAWDPVKLLYVSC